jgi:hypothetical protein
VHIVEQILLYWTATSTFLVHSTFLFEFFEQRYWSEFIIRNTEYSKILPVSIESDAIFDEKSESLLTFKFWTAKESTITDFSTRILPFFQKNCAKFYEKPVKYFSHIPTKVEFNCNEFITKTIGTKKNCTNSKSFMEFERGRQINMMRSYGYTLKIIS